MLYNKLLIGFSLTVSCLAYGMASVSDLYLAMITGLQTGNTEKLQRVLEQPSININAPMGQNNLTPLMAAIRPADITSYAVSRPIQYAIIDLILDRGADVTLPSPNGKTPIDFAIEAMDPIIIEKLKDKGLELDKNLLNAILTKAIFKNKLELLDLALRNGATPNQENLHDAIMWANPAIVKRLITHKNVHVTGEHLQDALNAYKAAKTMETQRQGTEKQRLALRAANLKEIGRMLMRHLGIYTGVSVISKGGIPGLPGEIQEYLSTFVQD